MWTLAEKQMIRQLTNQVLHVPGNFTKEILEMCIVFDMALPKERAAEEAAQLAALLKASGEVFRNVRLNVVRWRSDDAIETETAAMPMLLMGRYFASYAQDCRPKHADALLANLKMYQARSKLIFILAQDAPRVEDAAYCAACLKPFLSKKLIWLSGCGREELPPPLSQCRAACVSR